MNAGKAVGFIVELRASRLLVCLGEKMLRRLRMVLPLFFSFVLTLLPFQLLEYTQAQRSVIAEERELYVWEQQANNYLQLFANLWSFELQLKRRLEIFRKLHGSIIMAAAKPEKQFEIELKKRLPPGWQPQIAYAGVLEKGAGDFQLFKGDIYSKKRLRTFSGILKALGEEAYSAKPAVFPERNEDQKRLDRFAEGALGKDLTIEFLITHRRGKISSARLDGKNYFLFFDFIEDSARRIPYLLFFTPDQISQEQTIEMTQLILAQRFPKIASALIPLEEAGSQYLPIFEKRLDLGQRMLINEKILSREKARAEILPVGTMKKIGTNFFVREFMTYYLPYEILLVRLEDGAKKDYAGDFIFLLRTIFFSFWFLVMVKVLITARPLGFSIKSWLSMIFIVVGILPLIVLYIAGSFHLESAAFRQEQQSLREIIRQFEDADVSGEAILADYREFCRKLEQEDFWKQALRQWDSNIWMEAVLKLPALFEPAGLKFSACYIYPPPISGLSYLHHSFYQESSARDKSLSEFYHNWVNKAYFTLSPVMTDNKDYQMMFFAGEEGDEVLRLFMGNRADSDMVDLGDQKQFFYQNYILDEGVPKNWFFLRANIQKSYQSYLTDRVNDWNAIHELIFFALTKIEFPDPITILPSAGSDDKIRGQILKNAGSLIELAATTRSRMFQQTDDQIIVVYPCRKSGDYILTALMDLRDLHHGVQRQELMLGLVLMFLSIPVFFISKFISSYLVEPLVQVESGLKRVAEEDYFTPISLQRQDEIGELADAFDKMVDGIIERQNLGRFVSAGLDRKVTSDAAVGEEKLEKSFGAVLCSDIRSFTTLSESHSVRDIVLMLNEHLAEMSSVIAKNGGMVEQFIGDAILAVFTGDSEAIAARNAVKAAIAMMKAHKTLVKARVRIGRFPYLIGVGIESGQILSGALRAGSKNEYVLIGQSRIQAEILETRSKLGKHSRIVCSDRVKSLLTDHSFAQLADGPDWEVIAPEAQT